MGKNTKNKPCRKRQGLNLFLGVTFFIVFFLVLFLLTHNNELAQSYYEATRSHKHEHDNLRGAAAEDIVDAKSDADKPAHDFDDDNQKTVLFHFSYPYLFYYNT